CGSGTLGVTALIRNRRAILNDKSPEYVGLTDRRLKEDYSGWAAHLDEVGNNPDKPRMAVAIKKQKSLFDDHAAPSDPAE
ncbi:MAG: hypothetical protein WCF81_24835, partial [Roseiarcus sp.]